MPVADPSYSPPQNGTAHIAPPVLGKAVVGQRESTEGEQEEEKKSETVVRKEAFAAAAAMPPPDGTPPSIKNVLHAGGYPLDMQTRGFFEPRFGADLGHVRIHTDSDAGQSAKSVNARAYTLGSNIVFGNGEYQPKSEQGRHLLAHELAHTLQNDGLLKNTLLRQTGGEDNEEEYNPRTEILGLSAFDRRYPEVMRQFNNLEEQMDELDTDVESFGPRGFEFSTLRERYARARERWNEASARLDEFWSIARVMVAAGRAGQVLVVVNSMKRAQLAGGSGFGAIAFSPLATPHQRTVTARNRLNNALAERSETARVHEAVGEEIERERSAAQERESAPNLRSVVETVGDLRAYVLANVNDISTGEGRLRYAMGVANLLHANLGDEAASYIELFGRLETENPEFYALILFSGSTIGYLRSLGVEGLDTYVYREADRAGAHMLLGAWDFDESTGEERESPMWTLLLDVLVGIIPIVGQVADARDITGYIYRIGRYPTQRSNPWTWVGTVGTLIGLVPAAGDAGKSLLSAVRRAVTEVPVGRLSDDIVAAASRHIDGATLVRLLDETDDLSRSLSVRWTVIQGNALNAWDRILAELGPVLVRVSDFTQAELNLVRRAAAEHLPEGFRMAGSWLGQLVHSLWVTARLTARHEAADIIEMIRDFRELWTLTGEAAHELWSPTARFLANLEPAERTAVRASLRELAARESDDIAHGVLRILDDEPGLTSRTVPEGADAIPSPSRPTSGRSATFDDAVAETDAAAARPPTARVGRTASMRHREMLDVFTRALHRPGPGSEVYRVYDSLESYDDIWRAVTSDPMGDLPQGFVHGGIIHLPPNASSLTVLHESLHWASEQSGARTLLGAFVEEGMVESIARRIAGPEAGEVYEANVLFVRELARVLGQDVLDNALLHMQWGPMRRALNAHFDSVARTEEFYALIRRISGNGEPQELVDRARRMLAGMADDATLPDIRVPDTSGVRSRPPAAGGPDTIPDESRIPGVRAGEPPSPVVAATSEVSAPGTRSIGSEPLSTRSAPEGADPIETSTGAEHFSDPATTEGTEVRPRTARERIEARRRAAATGIAELEGTHRISSAESEVLILQLEEINRSLRIAHRGSAEELELLERQREELIAQLQELIEERRLIGIDWYEARIAREAASQEYFIDISNAARRYYPDGLEAVFGRGESVEHIVPRSRIFGMEGFDRLTREQQVSLFAWGPNLRIVPGEFNSARGTTPYARLRIYIWRRFTTDESIILRLARAEVDLEKRIQAMISAPSTIPALVRPH